MTVPIKQQIRVGAYIMSQRLRGRERYPLVLMLEPLFRCNLACAGCGKIDYPDAVLNRRLSVEDCVQAAEECGAPIVSIPGGEPLLHKEIGEIVSELIKRRRFVYLCTNGLLLEKKLHLFTPSDYLTFNVHLDGLKEEHDRSVCQGGVFDRAVSAIRAAKAKGFRVNVNATLFKGVDPDRVAAYLDFVTDDLKVDGVSISPGYAYERAPDQEHFLNRQASKTLFREIFRRGKGRRTKWRFGQSTMFLDFLAGNQDYRCTPWGTPTRNVFGWQRPCYLLNEGYVPTFRQLLDETDWASYGTGAYEKCADCMVHCGYEPTAVTDTVENPLKALKTVLRGIRTEGPMTPEISLEGQRPAEFVFERVVTSAIEHGRPPSAPAAGASKHSVA
ncbi:adenosyl-hopene transferase HpnH [Salinarimonas soli]|uniref:Adenosyl-hopene transferase HpnH n=1 Tax=Salinarimonas soli TaxID=1638099 RepID=A0A5B2VB37_9HYPH|nr:adenosyl-hopene transferase HpnH [Salinarimonas soli]KAA2235650.1 adenosyl-hopene transferase HpnH [Salinarimonas soli]